MTAKEYVVRQLEGYTQLRNDITTLEFELKSLAPFDELQTDDLIETLTFSHPTESPVQESRISDKTAAIALSYHTIGLVQTRDTRLRIASQLEVYQMLANRLDTYLCALYPEDAAVLKKHYFDGLSWQGIADAEHHCIRTVIKRRNRGMKRLTELYDRLARLGALPGVEPSM